MYDQVQTVTFVKRTSGGGGDLPPPPEPPAIEGQGLSVPAPPHGLKVKRMWLSSLACFLPEGRVKQTGHVYYFYL